MKRLLTFYLITGSLSSFAQDVIVKKNAETIAARVIEITETGIKYKPFKDTLQPVRVIAKGEVMLIYYQNGNKEVFSERNVEPQKFNNAEQSLEPKNLQEYRNGLKLGDIVMYKGPESGKYRKGRIIGFTTDKAIVANKGKKLELGLDQVSKFFDQPKSQR